MDWQFVLDHIKKGESNTNKFLGGVSSADDLFPYLVGMANTKGGIVFVGMDMKNFHFPGANIEKQWILEGINGQCHPFLDLEVSSVNRDDKEILVIQIKEGRDKPYFYNKQCYVMEDSTCKATIQKQVHFPATTMHTKPSESSRETTPNEDLEMITEELSQLAGSVSEQSEVQPLERETSLVHNEKSQDHSLNGSINESSEAPLTFEKGLNERQQKALDYLSKKESIRNKTYRALYGVSHKTAHLELVDLVKRDFIFQTGSGRSTCYKIKAPIRV